MEHVRHLLSRWTIQVGIFYNKNSTFHKNVRHAYYAHCYLLSIASLDGWNRPVGRIFGSYSNRRDMINENNQFSAISNSISILWQYFINVVYTIHIHLIQRLVMTRLSSSSLVWSEESNCDRCDGTSCAMTYARNVGVRNRNQLYLQ